MMVCRIAFAALLALSTVAAHAGKAAPDLKQRVQWLEDELQRLEDKDAIRDIMEDYAVRLTSRDFAGYVANFAPEGTWRNGDTIKRGHQEIRAMLLNMFPNTPANYVNHDSYMLVSDIQIKVDGDHATARSRQLSIIRGKKGDPTPVLAGRYEDEFVRRDGQWKILHRLDITFIPTLEQWTKKMQEGILTPDK
jgi:ketosteroid isomerase-like protein